MARLKRRKKRLAISWLAQLVGFAVLSHQNCQVATHHLVLLKGNYDTDSLAISQP